MPDLWAYREADIEKAARAIMQERGYDIAKVFRRTTGLFVSVQLTNGHVITMGESEIGLRIHLMNEGHSDKWIGFYNSMRSAGYPKEMVEEWQTHCKGE